MLSFNTHTFQALGSKTWLGTPERRSKMSSRTSIVTLLALMAPGLANAASYTVDRYGTGDYTTIQAAINASADGDIITVKAATYKEYIDFKGKKITVKSEKGAASTIIDTATTATYSVTFSNSETSAAVLQGFTLKNASRNGIYIKNASPTLKDISVKSMGSSTSYNGSGAYIDGGSPSFTDSEFSANVGYYGGHVYVTGSGSPTFNNTDFTSGYGYYGGGIYVNSGSADIEDSSIDGNNAYYHAGSLR